MSQVIPFPLKGPQKLNAALAEQRKAMAAFQAALNDLHEATSRLGGTLERYENTLSGLAGRVDALHSNAKALERWADGVLQRP